MAVDQPGQDGPPARAGSRRAFGGYGDLPRVPTALIRSPSTTTTASGRISAGAVDQRAAFEHEYPRLSRRMPRGERRTHDCHADPSSHRVLTCRAHTPLAPDGRMVAAPSRIRKAPGGRWLPVRSGFWPPNTAQVRSASIAPVASLHAGRCIPAARFADCDVHRHAQGRFPRQPHTERATRTAMVLPARRGASPLPAVVRPGAEGLRVPLVGRGGRGHGADRVVLTRRRGARLALRTRAGLLRAGFSLENFELAMEGNGLPS